MRKINGYHLRILIFTGALSFKTKKLEKVYLGVNYLDLSQVLASGQLEKGALLKAASSTPAIMPKSPAAIAGLEAGDIITKVNGQELSDEYNLALMVSTYNLGDRLIINYLRQEEEKQVTVVLKSLE